MTIQGFGQRCADAYSFSPSTNQTIEKGAYLAALFAITSFGMITYSLYKKGALPFIRRKYGAIIKVQDGEYKILRSSKEYSIRFNRFCINISQQPMLQALKELPLYFDTILFLGASSKSAIRDCFAGTDSLRIQPDIKGRVLLVFIPADLEKQSHYFTGKFETSFQLKEFLTHEGHKGYVMSYWEGINFYRNGKLSQEFTSLLTANINPSVNIPSQMNVFRKAFALGGCF